MKWHSFSLVLGLVAGVIGRPAIFKGHRVMVTNPAEDWVCKQVWEAPWERGVRYSRATISEVLNRSVEEWHLGNPKAWTSKGDHQYPYYVPTHNIIDFSKYRTNRAACQGSVGGALIAGPDKGGEDATHSESYQVLMSSEPDMRESSEGVIYLYTFCGVAVHFPGTHKSSLMCRPEGVIGLQLDDPHQSVMV
ncbi:hypothetical protein BDV93DRAFT_523148 [Ceratobasidium sp. AG-I]|nr:hypothetical protein BDV93DRAFT_523148 [Ceratobasidium sp. AG-I]